jgi:hypothetical protein
LSYGGMMTRKVLHVYPEVIPGHRWIGHTSH